MATTKEISADLIKKIQQCMKEAGLEAQVHLSEHEATAFATKKVEGGTLRAVAHVTDRDAKQADHGVLANREHMVDVAIYPTLAPQTAAGAGTKPHGGKTHGEKPPTKKG